MFNISKVPVEQQGKQTKVGGFIGEIWHKVLEKTMNFSTRIILAPDGNWGSRDENGSWNGMIQEVYENRAQVAICDCYSTLARSEVVQFSPILMEGNN